MPAKRNVHAFDYTTFQGFTAQQIKQFLKARRCKPKRRKQRAALKIK